MQTYIPKRAEWHDHRQGEEGELLLAYLEKNAA